MAIKLQARSEDVKVMIVIETLLLSSLLLLDALEEGLSKWVGGEVVLNKILGPSGKMGSRM